MGQEEAARAEEDATDERRQRGRGGGGGGGRGRENGEEVKDGDAMKLLELVSSLSDQDAAGMQVKVNHYVSIERERERERERLSHDHSSMQ